MKPSHAVLLFPAVLAAAKDFGLGVADHLVRGGAAATELGLCRRSSMLGGAARSPVCARDGGAALEEAPDGSLRPATSGWPHAAPCARNLNGTREFCVYSDPKFAKGRGILMLTSPEHAEEVARFSPFADGGRNFDAIPELNAEASARWHIEPVPGKGMGLVADRPLQLGDPIMVSTPSIMIDYEVFYQLDEARLHALQAAGVAGYLPERHRAVFLNLSTHDGAEDFSTRVNKIIQTNAFDIDNTGIVEVRDDNDRDSWYTVFPDVSRMNHDCRPNADYYFDAATFTHNIHAVRPIAVGEEITVSYIDPVLPRDERLRRLNRSWHFPCSCSACTQNAHATAASDARVAQIEELRRQLRDYDATSQATPAMGELMVSLYQQERLWTAMYEAYTYAAIEYNGAGDPWTATKYARLAVQSGLATGGPNDSDVLEMQALARDPWSHWSWLLRTKRRMNWGSHIAA